MKGKNWRQTHCIHKPVYLFPPENYPSLRLDNWSLVNFKPVRFSLLGPKTPVSGR